MRMILKLHFDVELVTPFQGFRNAWTSAAKQESFIIKRNEFRKQFWQSLVRSTWQSERNLAVLFFLHISKVLGKEIEELSSSLDGTFEIKVILLIKNRAKIENVLNEVTGLRMFSKNSTIRKLSTRICYPKII